MVAVILNSWLSLLRANQWQVVSLIFSRPLECCFTQKHAWIPLQGCPWNKKARSQLQQHTHAPEDSEKHVVSGLGCSFCLLGGTRIDGGVVSEYLGFKTTLSTWCKSGRQGTSVGSSCLKHCERHFMSPLCTLSVAGGLRSMNVRKWRSQRMSSSHLTSFHS